MKNLLVIASLIWSSLATAAEIIPPAPARYFNDYAHVTDNATAQRLNQTLENFEKETSSQVVVAVYPKMDSDSSMEDYTKRVFNAWSVGQKDKNNGAVLFVFVQDHRMRIATGTGLETTMPDALCKRILDNNITPYFRNGNYTGGLVSGVTAMLAAAKGAYQGTEFTVAQTRPPAAVPVNVGPVGSMVVGRYVPVSHGLAGPEIILLIMAGIAVVVMVAIMAGRSPRRDYRSRGWLINRQGYNNWPDYGGGYFGSHSGMFGSNSGFFNSGGGFMDSNSGSSGISSGSSGGISGDTSSFSGGGGSTDGGGASGSW